MKAIILAAGIGERLATVYNQPKCLLEFGDETLIQRHIRLLYEFGIKNTLIVVGYQKQKIIDCIGHFYKDMKIKYIVNDKYKEHNNIYSFFIAKNEIDDDILVMDSDVLFDKRILKKIIDTNKDNSLLIDLNYPNYGDEWKIVGANGSITTMGFDVKPSNGQVIGEEVGFTRISKKSIKILLHYANNYIKQHKTDLFFEDLLKDIIERLILKFNYLTIGDLRWTEIDFPDDIERAKNIYNEIQN